MRTFLLASVMVVLNSNPCPAQKSLTVYDADMLQGIGPVFTVVAGSDDNHDSHGIGSQIVYDRTVLKLLDAGVPVENDNQRHARGAGYLEISYNFYCEDVCSFKLDLVYRETATVNRTGGALQVRDAATWKVPGGVGTIIPGDTEMFYGYIDDFVDLFINDYRAVNNQN